MKRLLCISIIVFAVLFVNVSFAGNSPSPLLSKDFNNDFEKVIKENPDGMKNVLKLGFPKEFLDSTVNITSIGDFNSMNQNNINVEYVPMITVRHMLYALCNTDEKKGGWNVQPIYCCRNELGFTVKAGSKAPVIGNIFT